MKQFHHGVGNSANGRGLVHLFFGDNNVEVLFKVHYQFNHIQAVVAKIGNEIGVLLHYRKAFEDWPRALN